MKPFLGCYLLNLAWLAAQTITPAPAKFALDGRIEEWVGEAPTFELGDKVRVWARHNAQGLVVAGEGPDLEGLEVWLSASSEPHLPGVGWGNQFGEKQGTAASCAEVATKGDARPCLQWIERQGPYRARLRRLFLRKWNITREGPQETYATAAFASLTVEQRKRLELLTPKGTIQSKLSATEFELLIPWDAFPPVDRLRIERLGFQVDLRGRGYVRSTAAGFKGARYNGLPPVRVSPPVVTRVTPCDLRLTAANSYGELRPAYYFLNAALEARTVFLLQNDARGYQYAPDPDALSPGIRITDYFVQELERGEFLCSPPLTYRKSGELKELLPFNLTKGEPKKLPVVYLADGTRLLQDGPNVSYTEFGSGQCGACPIVEFKIFALSATGTWTEALSLGTRIEIGDYEIEVSPDLKNVKEFQEIDDRWSSVTHCLTGRKYRKCAENPHASPPRTTVVRDAVRRQAGAM